MPGFHLDNLEELFAEALSLPPDDRAAFLSSHVDDPDLRAEVVSLLEAAEEAGAYFENLAAAMASLPTGLHNADVTERKAPGLESGSMVAQYRIEGKLGAGGMGVVYRAEDTRLGRTVALKFLPWRASADGAAQRRLLLEARAAAALEHPNVCALYEAGEDADGSLFIAMGYYGGRTLREILADGPLPIEDVGEYARQTASALHFAHDRGVVHRDVKPDNLLVTPDGTVKVLDFGLAKMADATLTGEGQRLGTVAYMSPEQTRGEQVDFRTDLWSLGVVLYEMLSGRRPFRGDSDRALIHAIRHEDPEPLSKLRKEVSRDLEELVSLLLSKNPEARRSGFRSLLEESGRSHFPRLALDMASMWKIFAGWGAAALIVHLLADPVGDFLGLPLWFGGGALIVMLVILPVLLSFGWYAERRYRRDGADRKRIIRRGTAIASTVAFGTIGLASATHLAMRAVGIGPPATLVSSEVLAPKPEIVLADFASPPGDTTLARVATEALRIDLARSPAVRLVDAGRIRSILRLMDHRGSLDAETAREAAIRGGIPAVVAPEIHRVGGEFMLSASLLAPDPERLLTVHRVTAQDEDGLMAGIDALSRELRERFGEPLRSLRAATPLPQVTTHSLSALQKYLDGFLSDDERSIELLEEAVTLDDGFAMAWRRLGIVLANRGQERSRQVRAITRAFENRDRLSEPERYIVAATYHSMVTGEHSKVIDAAENYRALAARDPAPNSGAATASVWFGVAAREYMARGYRQLREYDRAEEVLDELFQSFPIWVCGSPNFLRSLILIDLGRLDAARRNEDALSRRCVQGSDLRAWNERDRGYVAGALGDYVAAEKHTLASLDFGIDDLGWRAQAAEQLASVYLGQGRIADARESAGAAMAAHQARGLASDRLRVVAETAAGETYLTLGTADASPATEEELARIPLADLHPLDRPYLELVVLHSRAARTGVARRLLGEFERSVEPNQRGPIRSRYHRARGELALAEGRHQDAIGEFRAADVGACTVCSLPGLARSYDAAGNADSAVAVFRRYVETRSGGDPSWGGGVPAAEFGPSLERLAQLLDARGERAQAARYYMRFAELWKDADSDLQPRVEVARRRLASMPSPKSEPPTTGSIRVITSSGGEDPDPSGYLVTVGEDHRSIEPDDTVVFRLRPVGEQAVRLGHLAENCSATGDTLRRVSVTGGVVKEVTFEVSCWSLPPAEVDVTGTWTGPFEALVRPWENRLTGAMTLTLEQDGDDVAAMISYDDPSWPGGPIVHEGTGRVSDRTLILFHLGMDNPQTWGPPRVTTMLEVSDGTMIGEDSEPQGFWEATMRLRRTDASR